MANRWGNNGNSGRFYFLGLQNHCSHEIKRHLLFGRKTMTNLYSIIKSRSITLPTDIYSQMIIAKWYSQSYGFSKKLCMVWELDHEEDWVPKNWCFWTMVLEKTLEKLSSLVAQRLKRLPAMQETWVRSLGQEDPLEKEMATHSSIFAWRIPWTEEPSGLQSTWSQGEYWRRLLRVP